MTDIIALEFSAAEESIGWAESASDELYALIKRFFEQNFAEIVTEIDPNTGEHVEKVRFTVDIPKDFRRKATEALISARHSFDQSIFAARNIVAGRGPGLNYPWAQNPTDLEGLFERRGIPDVLRDVIRSHQPYPASDSYTGGCNNGRALASIANNKHTVGLSIDGSITSYRHPRLHGHKIQSLKIMSPKWDSRKKEAELMRWIGDVKLSGDYNFEFVICLNDARLPQPIDVLFAMDGFTYKAKVALETLKARCIELN